MKKKLGWCSSENCQQVSQQRVLRYTTCFLFVCLFSSLRTEWRFPPSESQHCPFPNPANGQAASGVLLHMNGELSVYYRSDPSWSAGQARLRDPGQQRQLHSPHRSQQYLWEAREARQERRKEHGTGVRLRFSLPPLKKYFEFSKGNGKPRTSSHLALYFEKLQIYRKSVGKVGPGWVNISLPVSAPPPYFLHIKWFY